ncbi:replication initiation protein RepM [Acinetobacter baumannii]|uniref:RepB family plasmid replication initiator protein n=1 Tax=Acinetobacter baumannii TaxID=470 RepID=A0A2C9X346_ACIBA|nr:replication initiation protein RepM [Acinetobacter baumannii]OTM84291.1 RepB family plasmid replication initiator protein [Acinetobacter baumannii]
MSDLIVKDNALISASYNLDVIEQRIILLSIIKARETGTGIDANTSLEIHASDYVKHFKVERQTAYEALKTAVNNLFNRQFSYTQPFQNTERVEYVKSRWVSRISYVDESAILNITFAPDIVPLITKLEKHFTSYQLKRVAQLTSKYAIRLYELLIQWREVGKTPILEINDFRFKLGIEKHEYKQMGHFKSRVLDPAIQQINKFTDIKTEYVQHKSGRVITGFEFKFALKDSSSGEENTNNKNILNKEVVSMSDRQISLFANKLAYDEEFASRIAEIGESYEDLEKRLVKMLTKKENLVKWAKDLQRIGFKAN